jgi:hypothetical protein
MKENMATTGDVAGHAKPLGSPSPKKRNYKCFNVSSSTFDKIEVGPCEKDSWKSYFNEEEDAELIKFVTENPEIDIILRDNNSGKLRRITRNG